MKIIDFYKQRIHVSLETLLLRVPGFFPAVERRRPRSTFLCKNTALYLNDKTKATQFDYTDLQCGSNGNQSMCHRTLHKRWFVLAFIS